MLASDGFVPAEEKDAWRLIRSMKRSTMRLERMLIDLLDLASARGHGLSLRFGPVDMMELLKGVLDEMSALAAEKGVSLEGPGRMRKGLVVKGDEVRIQQIVQNLLSNAIKAAPPQGVVRVSAGRSNEHVRVSLVNPGVVMDPAIKDSLFEPFAKSAAGGYQAGAGLGLSVVDALVKAHGGSVMVTPGRKQVTFSFAIPFWNGSS